MSYSRKTIAKKHYLKAAETAARDTYAGFNRESDTDKRDLIIRQLTFQIQSDPELAGRIIDCLSSKEQKNVLNEIITENVLPARALAEICAVL